MRREGLTGILTNDRHFEQEGFYPIPLTGLRSKVPLVIP
jgi:hypothetical protein